jgi:5-methylcytosine-specific restriction enzyme subunit McrC
MQLDLQEWQILTPERGAVTYEVFLPDDEARAEAAQLTRAGILAVLELRTGLHVQARSFVGRVQLGNIRITVRPKMSGLQLLRMLRYAYCLQNLHLFEGVEYELQADALPELLLRQLAAEVDVLLTRGMRRAYVRMEANLASPRGRIQLQRIARNGITSAALPCLYHPRREDILLNQVLLASLHAGAHLTVDSGLRITLRRLALLLADSVSPIPLTRAAVERVLRELNRLSAVYRPALELIKLLVEGFGTVMEDEGEIVHVPGFFLNMNRLFQDVLSRFLRENLAGYELRDEYRLRNVLAYDSSTKPANWREPTPRPDYAVLLNGAVAQLLDAKYIDIWNRGISADVLYQLGMYASSRLKGGTAVILYPANDPAAHDVRVDVREPVLGDMRAQIIARPVHLDRLDKHLLDSNASSKHNRATFAHSLVFGSAV